MNKDLAIIVVSTCMKCAREIGDLSGMLKERCAPDEYQKLRASLGGIVFDIMDNVVSVALNDNPDLKSEIDSRISEYGKAF